MKSPYCLIFSNKPRNIEKASFVVLAVLYDEPDIAKTALAGSILSSCLMAFGTILLSGDIAHDRVFYPVFIAKVNAQLLVVSLFSVMLPTAFKAFSKGPY